MGSRVVLQQARSVLRVTRRFQGCENDHTLELSTRRETVLVCKILHNAENVRDTPATHTMSDTKLTMLCERSNTTAVAISTLEVWSTRYLHRCASSVPDWDTRLPRHSIGSYIS